MLHTTPYFCFLSTCHLEIILYRTACLLRPTGERPMFSITPIYIPHTEEVPATENVTNFSSFREQRTTKSRNFAPQKRNKPFLIPNYGITQRPDDAVQPHQHETA